MYYKDVIAIHSVDSVASYSSQNHVDRIRTQNFSAASSQEDSDFGSIKTSLFRRSISNLEYPLKRPDSVTSNASSTRSRLRELVERKSSQEEHKPAANTVADIQYFENPTETLEFDSPRNSLDSKKNSNERSKKRKLPKSKENNNKKNEKFQSKLAEYYKLPVQLPQDEFYLHLTRSRAADELSHKRFPNSDTEFSGSYGKLFIGRAKYQTKDEVLEGIYIDSTVSCFADINRQQITDENCDNIDTKSEKDFSERNESRNSKSVDGSWSNLNEEAKQITLSEDSIGHSRNPSEIDSLDSNYVRKHYNFEAHVNNSKDSPYTSRSITTNSKEFYTETDDHETDIEDKEDKQGASKILQSEVISQEDIDSTLHVPDTENSIQDTYHLCEDVKSLDDKQSLISENDETISSQAGSVTSYISISIASSTEKSQKLEHLANSLAEKIDEYCDLQSVESKSITRSENLPSDPIYTTVQKKKTFADIRRQSIQKKLDESKGIQETWVNSTCINLGTLEQDIFTSAINIKTEPFVTLIENQYYSLPDINISKCLRKSERIDAQLREEDTEDSPCENSYDISQTNIQQVLCDKPSENYGQLNKTVVEVTGPFENISSKTLYSNDTYPETHAIHCSKLEDDLKSITSINSSNPDNKVYFENHQNEREVNEIEGTIRNTKVITKAESLKINNSYKPTVKVLKSLSNDNIHKSVREPKVKSDIKKHYSLRQRDPSETVPILSPDTVIKGLKKESRPIRKQSFTEEIKNHSLLSRVQSFKTSAKSDIDIVPLGGHQTLIIDPPLKQEVTSADRSNNYNQSKYLLTEFTTKPVQINKENKETIADNNTSRENLLKSEDSFITIKLNKVVKTSLPKLQTNACENIENLNYHCHSSLPIYKEKEVNEDTAYSNLINNQIDKMTRPQILQVVDSKTKLKKRNDTINLSLDENYTKSKDERQIKEEINTKSENYQVKEKLDDAIKTDIEYQEKINSVKSYWSKLIQTPENNKMNDLNKQEKEEKPENSQPILFVEKDDTLQTQEDNSILPEISVGKIIKSLESVKIVDSIKKIGHSRLNLWKDESEKVKSDSEIEETLVEKIEKGEEIDNNVYEKPKPNNDYGKSETDMHRDTPDIEIVELRSEDNLNQKTQATLIKAKGFEKGCDDFDHVRYKVMKSELFKNSMIANYRKEAQFDGLLQYLQEYSFQELLTNNNIVIIEPVRTKIEPTPKKAKNTETCKISPNFIKRSDGSFQSEKSKNSVRRHFFYHPIRVNKEIIEEELPNPDTVKKVRNLFEDTLKMKSPMTLDSRLEDETMNTSKRSLSYKNLNEEVKIKVGRKRLTKPLTIDTNIGSKKWDNSSLSSGVSSGDLSSNNEYETDALSPISHKNIKDNVYSSSEEYLCDSSNQDFCCESQYVSPDILKKIRECGTSITYYGGKVLNSKTISNLSPMTKAIMEEIKGLQKDCSRDCDSCQTKCKGDKCRCLTSDKHKKNVSEIPASQTSHSVTSEYQRKSLRPESFPGFKFKLVKSNSCSSRLELTGTDDTKRFQFRRQNSKDDPPLVQDEENSVKNKINRLESYNKGPMKTPIQVKKNEDRNNNLLPDVKKPQTTVTQQKTDELNNKKIENILSNNANVESLNGSGLEKTSNVINDHAIEKKFYYVNNNVENNKTAPTGKFGEMIFEEFEVLESCYDSLNSNKSLN
ncbi:unnamed protein product [Leptidea sinapis]|uniref:Uncharacterized protein n=1 Tax=Leptidea sinapis TaxID=189913 RepID=A0A5E4R3L3_9NEOP|nr:unnamed protein product [Leptidea sinapis]